MHEGKGGTWHCRSSPLLSLSFHAFSITCSAIEIGRGLLSGPKVFFGEERGEPSSFLAPLFSLLFNIARASGAHELLCVSGKRGPFPLSSSSSSLFLTRPNRLLVRSVFFFPPPLPPLLNLIAFPVLLRSIETKVSFSDRYTPIFFRLLPFFPLGRIDLKRLSRSTVLSRRHSEKHWREEREPFLSSCVSAGPPSPLPRALAFLLHWRARERRELILPSS